MSTGKKPIEACNVMYDHKYYEYEPNSYGPKVYANLWEKFINLSYTSRSISRAFKSCFSNPVEFKPEKQMHAFFESKNLGKKICISIISHSVHLIS